MEAVGWCSVSRVLVAQVMPSQGTRPLGTGMLLLATVQEVTAAPGTAGAPRAAATTSAQPQPPLRNQNFFSENTNSIFFFFLGVSFRDSNLNQTNEETNAIKE